MITVIVMLILVVVTINVALNGGLFEKAETAKVQTEKAVEEEQLMTAIVTAYDAKTGVVDKSTLQTELTKQGNWQISGEEGGPYGVTSPKGNAYTVTKDGKITTGWVDNGDGSYTKGDTTVTVGQTTYTNAEVLEKLGIEESEYTGTYGSKEEETWTVIGVEGDKIKLVSTKNVASSVKLGQTDDNAYEKNENGNVTTTIKSEIQDYNSDGEVGEYDIAVWSYANAVKKLNDKAKEATGIESARSIKVEDIYDIIGEKNVTKDTSYGSMYNYYFNGTTVYSKFKATANDEYNETRAYNTYEGTQTFVKYPDNIEEDSVGEIIQIHSGNSNASIELTDNSYNPYTLTPEQQAAVGSLVSGNSYWLASPCVRCYSNRASFRVRYMDGGKISRNGLFNSNGGAYNYSRGVRAVVSI